VLAAGNIVQLVPKIPKAGKGEHMQHEPEQNDVNKDGRVAAQDLVKRSVFVQVPLLPLAFHLDFTAEDRDSAHKDGMSQ
jgi:hypothetical protein